ncbi:MGMT family protein [Natronocalculus amylovorans]|uniref:MGMT family protein n=1 Tax=Natronocalculus amylovorans TaxID=2917812 RepID=A0AAE3FU96_9EURY|nr:MGMT family protein [Natronocalculus amylovorans]MCL9815469.1 MGMT family protein [Natronocalculus amylovorans]NUE02017.1 methylated-DNA--[protein]-cysteine S-methyltransferase [Halorubraceae archaeon YAN]
MDDAGIYARPIEDLDRVLQIGVAGSQLISVSFPTTVPADAGSTHEFLDIIETALSGESEQLGTIPVALTIPTEQRGVLETLRDVPAGRTITTDRLAQFAGLDPSADGVHRTVQDALRANPVPYVIPDHRVRDGQGATPPAVAAALRRRE